MRQNLVRTTRARHRHLVSLNITAKSKSCKIWEYINPLEACMYVRDACRQIFMILTPGPFIVETINVWGLLSLCPRLSANYLPTSVYFIGWVRYTLLSYEYMQASASEYPEHFSECVRAETQE
jgi:hypothetical protein